jgi:hypothetical protein
MNQREIMIIRNAKASAAQAKAAALVMLQRKLGNI